MNKIQKFLDKDIRTRYFASKGLYNYMSDEKYLKKMFLVNLGYTLNLDNPVTFNEKLQWLKVNDRKPEYTMMVDKYRVRDYIAEQIGEEYLIPLLGVWDSPEDIDFASLPDQFVLKCNHNSGLGMCICKDKSKLNVSKVKKELWKGLRQNYYLTGREWPYKDVPRKIICEKYMEDSDQKQIDVYNSKPSIGELTDYKFFCFEGKPLYCQVISDRRERETIDFYDLYWNRMPFLRENIPNANKKHKKPICLDKMIQFAETLSKQTKFVRIDFYEIAGKLYFGEITFYPASGFKKLEPDEWNYKFGEHIKL